MSRKYNYRGSPYFFSEWSSLFLLTAYQTYTFIFDLLKPCDIFLTMENDWWLLILRNHSQWKIVQWSRISWKSCIPGWKKVYYVFLFLKVSRCKLKQKETILKLGNALKSKSKIGLGASTSTPYQSFTLNPLGAFWLLAKFSLCL
jgi:hypothetical protein